MGKAEKKERFDKLSGAQLLWASTMGAAFDLGIMSKAMLTPSMKTAAQRLVLHQMQKGSFPFLEDVEISEDFFKEAYKELDSCLNFANKFEVKATDNKVELRIDRDSCMYCPTGVGGAMPGLSICPYPQLFSLYIDNVLKNSYKFKTAKMIKEKDGSYMHNDGDWDIITFDILDDDNFKSIVEILKDGVKSIEEAMNKAVESGDITKEDMWDRNYIEVPDTNPQKYKTKFTDFAKQYIQPIEDEILEKNKKFVFIVLVDDNGYLPSHNTKYDKPLTGDYKTDLLGNRSMRIFNDFTGLSAARSEREFLLQPYPRDVGVLMYDVSAPVFFDGKHWGGLRIGFKS